MVQGCSKVGEDVFFKHDLSGGSLLDRSHLLFSLKSVLDTIGSYSK